MILSMEGVSKKQITILIALALIALTLAVYWPVQSSSFLNYDDHVYVTENSHVKAGLSWEGLKWAFTALECGFYQPLTWLTYLLDFEVYHLNAGGYHWTNLLFHLANTILLFWVLSLMTGSVGKSGFVAVLFALHPLHVESVAWISERKDVVSGFFWFLTMGAYFYYTKKPRVSRYLLVLMIFVLGLMAKPMAMSLPFVLLLLDFWPLRRVDKTQVLRRECSIANGCSVSWYQQSGMPMVLEKIPMILISFCFLAISVFTQNKADALPTLVEYPFDQRLNNALIAYVAYIRKMFFPWDLAIPYPYPVTVDFWGAALAGIFIILVSLVVYLRVKSSPYLSVGWLWYLGTMIPVIGLVQIGSHAMGDRYTYIPLIGLFISIVWGVSDLVRRLKYRQFILTIIGATAVVVMMILSGVQVRYWKNAITLFQHTIQITENNIVAHNNLGQALMEANRISEAKVQFREALRLSPFDTTLRNNYGTALYNAGEKDEAIKQFKMAQKISPKNGDAYVNLGMIFLLHGQVDEAISQFAKATKYSPGLYNAWKNMARALMKKGDMEGAIVAYRRAVLLNPIDYNSHNDLGFCLAEKGRFKQAASSFSKALEIKPDFSEAKENLDRALRKIGQASGLE